MIMTKTWYYYGKSKKKQKNVENMYKKNMTFQSCYGPKHCITMVN